MYCDGIAPLPATISLGAGLANVAGNLFRVGHPGDLKLTMRVVFLDRASLKATMRRFAFPAEYIEHPKTAVEETVARLSGADVAIINKVPMHADTLRRLPQLKMIAVAATGY